MPSQIRSFRFTFWMLPGLVVALALGWPCRATAAAAWPTKGPITFIVPFAPGGGADLIGRLVASKMSVSLGQSIIVQNRPGASGQIGEGYAAQSAPEGYTVLIDASSFLTNKYLYSKLPYDPDKSFIPVGVLARFPLIAVVTPSFKAQSLAQLIDMAKAQPGKIFFASGGVGSVQDLAGRLFSRRANVKLGVVPYKGGGPAMIDVMGGQVPLLFGNGASALPAVRAGSLRALAVTGEKRLAALPTVPTLAESGIKGVDLYEWNGMFVPAGTPIDIVDKLADALTKALDSPQITKEIADLGGERLAGGRAAAGQFLAQQSQYLGKAIHAENIHGE